jgi:hypothetical protein
MGQEGGMKMEREFWDLLLAGLSSSDLDWLMIRIERRRACLHPEKVMRKTIIRKEL